MILNYDNNVIVLVVYNTLRLLT